MSRMKHPARAARIKKMEMIRSRLRKIRSGTKPSTATAIIAVIWNETAISASSQNKKRPSCRDVSGQEKIGGNPTLTQRIKREAYLKAAHNATAKPGRSEEHTSELQSRGHLVCRLLLEKKKKKR